MFLFYFLFVLLFLSLLLKNNKNTTNNSYKNVPVLFIEVSKTVAFFQCNQEDSYELRL